MEVPEPEGVALEVPADDESPPARVPRRIRRRFTRGNEEGGGSSGKASTAEGIQAKLREADLRRQKFHRAVSSKARYMFRIAQSQEVPPGQPLEVEKRHVQDELLQLQLVSNIASSQKETERNMSKEQLENKLQRAKWQRADYLKERGSPPSSVCSLSIKNGEFLSRKLARCWRRFIICRKTTVMLAKAFDALGINQHSVLSMSFEEISRCIESPTVCHTTKAFLDRLETRFVLSQPSSSSKPERTALVPKRAAGNSDTSKLPRYKLKLVLCAYMILGHPEFVCTARGERMEQLVNSAASLMKEFELLVKTVLDGPDGACSVNHLTVDAGSPGSSYYQDSSSIVLGCGC